jgi:hypothetical protein
MTPKDLVPSLDEITPENLAERAILVSFHRKSWSPTARDRDLEYETKERKGYLGDATIRKVLIDKTFLTEWAANARAAGTFHKEMTLPWTDRGFRVLLGPNIERYTEGMAEFVARDRRLAVELQQRWPDIIENSKTLWPEELYDPTNYPTTDEILSLFEIGWDERPVPTKGDFRLTAMSDAMRERMQENLERAVSASIALAIEEPWMRLTESVQRMIESLTREGRFEYTMLTQLSALAGAIPGLNLTNDPRLAKVASDIFEMIEELKAVAGEPKIDDDDTDADIDRKRAQKAAAAVRKDDELKAETARKAQEVLERMSGFMGGAK